MAGAVWWMDKDVDSIGGVDKDVLWVPYSILPVAVLYVGLHVRGKWRNGGGIEP
uniref:Uncharacterized protein n=1 Tax=Oryza glaberrima TaxID=4538 RepID=I1R051_ORYGL